MRSRQINFFLTARDQAALMTCLMHRLGPFSLISSISQGDQPELLETAEIRSMGLDRLKIFLVREVDLEFVTLQTLEHQPHKAVDGLRSPVIEFSRCHHSGDLLRRGRMYLNSSFYGRDGTLIKKEPAFLDWASAMLHLVRRTLRTRVPPSMFYCGPEALELNAAGCLDIV